MRLVTDSVMCAAVCSTVLAGVGWVGEGEAGGADVLAAVPGGHGGVPLARQRGQERRRLATRGTDREVNVLERPLQRELRGVVAAVHLVQLGVGQRGIQPEALKVVGE